MRYLRRPGEPFRVFELISHGQAFLPPSESQEIFHDPQLQGLDQNALESSAIKLSAHPWTDVVGDGLFSELIADFFAWDNVYLFPSVDQDAFLQEMRKTNTTTSKYCTPLLVNAICSQRSVRV